MHHPDMNPNDAASAANYNDNKELRFATRIVEETSTSLFLTGKAGTGKTTFLRRLRENSSKRMVVLAPTGIAAINAGGQTIHSFFQFSFSPYIPGVGMAQAQGRERLRKDKLRVIRTLDLLVIDEISMVRADLLDAVDAALRRYRRSKLPFGGVQLLLIGDLSQLPPVVKEDEWEMLSQHYATPYFFSSRALSSIPYETVELRRVYRQEEGLFLNLLNNIRENRVDAATLAALNSRYLPGFVPPEKEKWIRLVTHNAQADNINELSLLELPGQSRTFSALVKGEFTESSFPADKELTLKVGAQVMFIKNDPSGKEQYYNGMIGVVIDMTENSVTVLPEDGGPEICVAPEQWQNNKYVVDPAKGEMKEQIVGEFLQIPLRKAWAITIHKSQGLTFDHAIIDASSAFTHGQTYVALSRCRTLEGMVLGRPLSASAVICDPCVVGYLREHLRELPDEGYLNELRQKYFLQLADELFSLDEVIRTADAMKRLVEMHFQNVYPTLAERWRRMRESLPAENEVAARFGAQYRRLVAEGAPQEAVQDRIRKGAAYFSEKLRALKVLYTGTPTDHDNKETAKRIATAAEEIAETVDVKLASLVCAAERGLDAESINKAKALALIALGISDGPRRKKSPKKAGREVSSPDQPIVSGDVRNPKAFQMLRNWRLKKANELGVPAYQIFGNKTLVAITNEMPATRRELAAISGVGKKMMQRYCDEILSLLASVSESPRLL